jgi:hypothetical protein
MKIIIELDELLAKELQELAEVHAQGNTSKMAEDILLRTLNEPEWQRRLNEDIPHSD